MCFTPEDAELVAAKLDRILAGTGPAPFTGARPSQRGARLAPILGRYSADTRPIICVSVAELEEVLGLKPPGVPSVGNDRSQRTVRMFGGFARPLLR